MLVLHTLCTTMTEPNRFWSVKRIDPFGEPAVNVSDDRLRSRLKAELGRSATTTLLVRKHARSPAHMQLRAEPPWSEKKCGVDPFYLINKCRPCKAVRNGDPTKSVGRGVGNRPRYGIVPTHHAMQRQPKKCDRHQWHG